MATRIEQLERYYDYHAREDEEVGQGYYPQAALDYLVSLLKWLLIGQAIGVATSINTYHEAVEPKKSPAPDIAIIDGVEIDHRAPGLARSHFIGRDGPAPRVVFEISSERTWAIDLGVARKVPVEDQKPALYARMGIREYFVFDPHQEQLWTVNGKAKTGWWAGV